MNEQEYQPSYITANPTPRNNVIGTKIPSAVTFAIGLMLFLLPFVELKCSSSSTGPLRAKTQLSFSNTGLGLALGSEWKLNVPGMEDFMGNDENIILKKNVTSPKPNIYSIIALTFGMSGLLLSFSNKKALIYVSCVVGVLAAGALVAIYFDLRDKMKDFVFENKNKPDGVSLSFEFVQWYYIAIIALCTAAVFSYLRLRSWKKTH